MAERRLNKRSKFSVHLRDVPELYLGNQGFEVVGIVKGHPTERIYIVRMDDGHEVEALEEEVFEAQ